MSFNWPVLFCLLMTIIVSNTIIEATIKDSTAGLYKIMASGSIGLLFAAAGFTGIVVN